MNIIRKSNQKNLGFRKSMELKVNGGSNTTVLSDVAVYSLNLAEGESVALGTENGKTYLVTLKDNTGFEIKGNNINTKQFSMELLDTLKTDTSRDNIFIFTIGEMMISNDFSCRELTFKEVTPLVTRKSSTTV